jgi:hypothetical protein
MNTLSSETDVVSNFTTLLVDVVSSEEMRVLIKNISLEIFLTGITQIFSYPL